MKITRRGANRDMGETVLARNANMNETRPYGDEGYYGPYETGKQSVTFDQETKQIQIHCRGVTNFDKSGQYNFTVSLPLEDIAEILEQLAGTGLKEALGETRLALESSKIALLKLLACAEGYRTLKLPATEKEL